MKSTSFVYLLIFLVICSACSKPDYTQTKETPPYVVSKIDSTLQAQWKESSIPPPPTIFYGDYNLIVDNDSKQIFLHRKTSKLFCGTGLDLAKPDFLYLSPEDIEILSYHNLEKELINIYHNLGNKQSLVLASLHDSINVKEARTLLDSIFISRKIIRFSIRMVTEEEKVVLEHKKRNLPYSADSIQWSDNFSLPFYSQKEENQ